MTEETLIYPADFERKTGFDRLRRQIADACTMQAARKLVDAERFTASADEIMRRQSLADEMRSMIQLERDFPAEEFPDLGDMTDIIGIEGSWLPLEKIVVLRRALASAGAVVDFISRRDQRLYPCMRAMSEGVETFPHIVAAIDRIVDRFGEIRDDASPELRDIRRSIAEHESRVSKRLQQILSSAKSAGITDTDAAISIRDGRAVIPVPAANKRKLHGFVHDESATGKTVYIEPVEVVEINNELRELEYAERREIVRILAAFTESLRPHADGIAAAGDFLAHVDMIRAKARWAAENGCSKPILSTDDRLVLRNARHPLLEQTLREQRREIVPLQMQLDASKRILVISGPNAGGKSVCLKTAGVVQYMFQCGFPVPATENSELPVFRAICIDIGDEQSMDDDLSTYSSHLLNMKNMLAAASPRTMVLIDEFGSGTEPAIGGAIAETILERLLERGCYGVITTHYANIKYFAADRDGIANGAMMFDVKQIRPLFRLETGKPGSSFAIEIARKTGLPEDIIREAGEKVGSDRINIEKQLREISRDRRYWEQKRDRIRIADRKVEELERNYAEQLAGIRAERAEILRAAREEARRLVSEANRTIENTVRQIREAQAERETTRSLRREFDSFAASVDSEQESEASERIGREMERLERRRARRAERRAAGEGSEPAEAQQPEQLPIEVGSKVRIEGREIPGVVRAIKGSKAQVVFGEILTTVRLEQLCAVSNAEYKRATRPVTPRTVVSVDISERKLNFRDRIDVRGMRASEALETVRDLVDDALMLGIGSVTILHGKGTGALKEEIRRYLRTVPDVESAVDEHADRGGAGITIVTFKNS